MSQASVFMQIPTLRPQKEIPWVVGRVALEASYALPTAVFPSGPSVTYVNQPKELVTRKGYHCQHTWEQNG
jgi:hypothetical protein